jgi:putative glutamine amidotransferase
VEAVAEDGTVEAVSVRGAASFALGVQWHAEWRVDAFPLHRTLFRHFATAVRAYATRRIAQPPSIQRLAAE